MCLAFSLNCFITMTTCLLASRMQEYIDVFFGPDNIARTLTRLINANRIFMRDPTFEIAHMALSSTISVAMLDRGIAFFVKDLTVCLSYKSLSQYELSQTIDLIQNALENNSIFMNQQRGGGLCIQFCSSKPMIVLPHLSVLRAINEIIMRSDISTACSKSQIVNVLYQRLDRCVSVDKKALRQIQQELRGCQTLPSSTSQCLKEAP